MVTLLVPRQFSSRLAVRVAEAEESGVGPACRSQCCGEQWALALGISCKKEL